MGPLKQAVHTVLPDRRDFALLSLQNNAVFLQSVSEPQTMSRMDTAGAKTVERLLIALKKQ